MKQPLSPRQADVLAVMVTFRVVKGYWPTRRELAASMVPPVSYGNGIHWALQALVKKGWLRKYSTSRGWELIHEDHRPLAAGGVSGRVSVRDVPAADAQRV